MAYEYRTSFTAAAQADREETIVDGRFSSGDRGLVDGSVTQGALYFADDKNTGIYSPSNDTISFSTAGEHALTITPERTLKLGTGNANNSGTYYNDIVIDNSDSTGDPGSTGAASSCGVTLISKNNQWGSFMFSDNDEAFRGGIKYNHGSTEYMEIHSGGLNALTLDVNQNATFTANVNVGEATGSLPRFVAYRATQYANNPVLQVRSDNGSSNRVLFEVDGDGTSTFGGKLIVDEASAYDAFSSSSIYVDGYICMGKTDEQISENEQIGGLRFYSNDIQAAAPFDDSVNFLQVGCLDVEADGDFLSGDIPTRMVFKTMTDGTTTLTEALRLDKNQDATFAGNIKMAADKGIQFHNYGAEEDPDDADTDVTANTLDDYEEGTFTPSIVDENGGTITTPLTSTAETGLYTKVGRLVHLDIRVYWGGKSGSPSGNVRIAGLPFATNSTADFRTSAAIGWCKGLDFANNDEQLIIKASNGESHLDCFFLCDDQTTPDQVKFGSISSSGEWQLSLTYQI
tara:strand:+ start:350 stop:1894 length:1545 start_codon:yes stop_codon:yes gene_type:complete